MAYIGIGLELGIGLVVGLASRLGIGLGRVVRIRQAIYWHGVKWSSVKVKSKSATPDCLESARLWLAE